MDANCVFAAERSEAGSKKSKEVLAQLREISKKRKLAWREIYLQLAVDFALARFVLSETRFTSAQEVLDTAKHFESAAFEKKESPGSLLNFAQELSRAGISTEFDFLSDSQARFDKFCESGIAPELTEIGENLNRLHRRVSEAALSVLLSNTAFFVEVESD